MFRDPAYFRALRETVVPLLRTYPSLKVWVAGCSTGEEAYSLAILLREEGLLARTLIYATDINPHALAEGRGRRLRRRPHRGFTENHRQLRRARRRCPTTTPRPTAARCSTSRCSRHIVFSDHSLATDSVFAEVQLVSCRNVLIYFNRELQDRALGLFREALCRKGFLGLGAKESLRFSAHARRLRRAGARGSHLPEEGRGVTRSTSLAAADRRASSSARPPAASRRCRVLLPALPAGLARAGLHRAAPAARAAEPAGRASSRRKCALPVRRRRTRSRWSRARSTSRRPTITCSSTRGRSSRSRADEPVHFSRPSIDVLFESAADVYGEPAARHHPDRRQRGRRRGARRRSAAPAASPSCRSRTTRAGAR